MASNFKVEDRHKHKHYVTKSNIKVENKRKYKHNIMILRTL